MNNRLLTIVLLVGLFFSSGALLPKLMRMPAPGNQVGYEPVQPIEFSHRLHCTELEISCLYCHLGADKSPHAGIPPTSVCLNCHKSVTAPLAELKAEEALAKKEKRKTKKIVSRKLEKLYTGQPIKWVKVHNLPDHACFNHQAHVKAGVACQQCHGPVEMMERVRQVHSLSMGWCINCHREVNDKGVGGKQVHATMDCAACHH